MPLRIQIEEKLNQALKAKDKNIYPTLRLVVSAIKDAEIAGRSKGQKEMTDGDITAILKKMIKQRKRLKQKLSWLIYALEEFSKVQILMRMVIICFVYHLQQIMHLQFAKRIMFFTPKIFKYKMKEVF